MEKELPEKYCNKTTVELLQDYGFCNYAKSHGMGLQLLLKISEDESKLVDYASINILLNNKEAYNQILESNEVSKLITYYKSSIRTFFCYQDFLNDLELCVEQLNSNQAIENFNKILEVYGSTLVEERKKSKIVICDNTNVESSNFYDEQSMKHFATGTLF
ncbi:MAG: hypothetical protein ACPGUI_00505 [Halarcobacter sp.]